MIPGQGHSACDLLKGRNHSAPQMGLRMYSSLSPEARADSASHSPLWLEGPGGHSQEGTAHRPGRPPADLCLSAAPECLPGERVGDREGSHSLTPTPNPSIEAQSSLSIRWGGPPQPQEPLGSPKRREQRFYQGHSKSQPQTTPHDTHPIRSTSVPSLSGVR